MSALEAYFDVIVDLLRQKITYAEISALLFERYGLDRGASERSIRQFAKENDINPKNLGKEAAHIAVSDAVREVPSISIYLLDDSNVAIFPNSEGIFEERKLQPGAHYEVAGDSETTVAPTQNALIPPSSRFSFLSPVASSSSPSLSSPFAVGSAHQQFRRVVKQSNVFSRKIILGRVVRKEVVTDRTIFVRLSPETCNATDVCRIFKECANVEDETYVLVDSKGDRIDDNPGSEGIDFWKCNSRKVMAITEADHQKLQENKRGKRRRVDPTSDDDEEDLPTLHDSLAPSFRSLNGLKSTIESLKSLNDRLVLLNQEDISTLKNTFSCILCTGAVDKPMVTSCCQSIVGCKSCIETYEQESSRCMKCRSELVDYKELKGLGDFILKFKPLIINN